MTTPWRSESLLPYLSCPVAGCYIKSSNTSRTARPFSCTPDARTQERREETARQGLVSAAPVCRGVRTRDQHSKSCACVCDACQSAPKVARRSCAGRDIACVHILHPRAGWCEEPAIDSPQGQGQRELCPRRHYLLGPKPATRGLRLHISTRGSLIGCRSCYYCMCLCIFALRTSCFEYFFALHFFGDASVRVSTAPYVPRRARRSFGERRLVSPRRRCRSAGRRHPKQPYTHVCKLNGLEQQSSLQARPFH